MGTLDLPTYPGMANCKELPSPRLTQGFKVIHTIGCLKAASVIKHVGRKRWQWQRRDLAKQHCSICQQRWETWERASLGYQSCFSFLRSFTVPISPHALSVLPWLLRRLLQTVWRSLSTSVFLLRRSLIPISAREEMRCRLLKIFMSRDKVIYKLYGKKNLFFALLFHLDNVLWMHPTQKVYVLSAVTSRVLVLQLPFCSNSPTQLMRERP